MDFEAELRELIAKAREAGVDIEAIHAALGDLYTELEDEADPDAVDDDDG
jgi:hypothetical protein